MLIFFSTSALAFSWSGYHASLRLRYMRCNSTRVCRFVLEITSICWLWSYRFHAQSAMDDIISANDVRTHITKMAINNIFRINIIAGTSLTPHNLAFLQWLFR